MRVPDSNASCVTAPKDRASARFERPSGILDVLARAIPQQLVDHRISAVDEFDDQVCPESGKPLDQIGDRNVPADDHVVDEREAQDEFG